MIACLTHVYCQVDSKKGISFEHNLNWTEILHKAKTENRYIFVDCYASWCGPCKWMEENVFTKKSVGGYMDSNFISIKIQMDTARGDNDEIRRGYAIADEMKHTYHVNAYPTYLFFSPEGTAVHKYVGVVENKDFFSVAFSALDSEQQYYTLLRGYRDGPKNYKKMPLLLDAAQKSMESKVSDEVATDYIQNYLNMFSDIKEWTKQTIAEINLCSGWLKCEDKVFERYFQNREVVDSIMKKPGYADDLIKAVIYQEKIKPFFDNALRSGRAPKWRRLEKEMTSAYGVYFVQENLLESLVEYNKKVRRWNEYTKYFIQLREAQGIENIQPTTAFNRLVLNNAAYEVFQYAGKKQLKKALAWVDLALSTDSCYYDALDTKANILYKLGRKAEGLALEDRAYVFAPKGSRSYAGIKENYEKMNQNKSTWVSK